jgi:hypothetical protein
MSSEQLRGGGGGGDGRHCFTYMGSPNGHIQRPNPVRYVQYECYKNWPVCDPRAAPPGEYGLKSG